MREAVKWAMEEYSFLEEDMKIVILAGGSGTRLWPLSRVAYPKQFLKIWDETSFLQKRLAEVSIVSSAFKFSFLEVYLFASFQAPNFELKA